QTVGTGNIGPAVECTSNHGQECKEEKRHSERAHRQGEAEFLAEKIGKNQSTEFHATPPAGTPWGSPDSTSTPFSRCKVRSARLATTGSCVTVSTVFPYSFTKR